MSKNILPQSYYSEAYQATWLSSLRWPACISLFAIGCEMQVVSLLPIYAASHTAKCARSADIGIMKNNVSGVFRYLDLRNRSIRIYMSVSSALRINESANCSLVKVSIRCTLADSRHLPSTVLSCSKHTRCCSRPFVALAVCSATAAHSRPQRQLIRQQLPFLYV